MTGIVKNVVVFGGLFLLAAFGYYLFVLRDTTTTGVSTASVDLASVAEREAFVRSLQELQSIQLNTAVFSDSRFSQLVDNNTPLQEVPVGRVNPFAPAN